MCDFSQYRGPSEEWLAIEASVPSLAAAVGQATPAEMQAIVNGTWEQMSAKAMEFLGSKVKTRDHTIPTRDGQTIEARSYRLAIADDDESGGGGEEEEEEKKKKKKQPLPVYMHMHGGGFIFGTLASEDAVCSSIAIQTGVIVFSVNYRHTPQYVYPTAWNDVEDAFEWLHAHMEDLEGDKDRVVLGATSAGSMLATSLVLAKNLQRLEPAAQGRPPIVGQVLAIPCLVHSACYDHQLRQIKDPSVSSYEENKDAPLLPRSTLGLFFDLLKVENPDPNDLRLNPGNASPDQVRGLPPTTLAIAGFDPLRDEGLLYAKLLAESGIPTSTHIFRGLPHGFRRFGNQLSESKRWDEVIVNGIKWALGRPEATGEFLVQG